MEALHRGSRSFGRVQSARPDDLAQGLDLPSEGGQTGPKILPQFWGRRPGEETFLGAPFGVGDPMAQMRSRVDHTMSPHAQPFPGRRSRGPRMRLGLVQLHIDDAREVVNLLGGTVSDLFIW